MQGKSLQADFGEFDGFRVDPQCVGEGAAVSGPRPRQSYVTPRESLNRADASHAVFASGCCG